MAWNHNSYEKPNAWDDSKSYKADRLLEDLQIYRITSGQVNAEDYASMMDKLGWDASKLSKLTDDEKMGYIGQILNEERKKKEYYATSSSKSKKQKGDTTQVSLTEAEIQARRASDKNKRIQNEKKELKKEIRQMQASAPSNPVILEFPVPNTTDAPIETENVSIFQRPLAVPPSKEVVEQDPSESEDVDEDVIQFAKDAPLAPILGPFCCICGRYGQYVCDLTEEDVCSIECKKKAEAIYHTNHPKEKEETVPKKEDVVGVDPTKEHLYMPRKRRYKDAVTILDSHKCPLCGKTGHLPQDCYLASGKYIHISNFERGEHSDTNEHFIQGDALTRHEKDELHRLYKKCKEVRENPTSCCSECKGRSNLVYCLHCNSCFCDKYHLLHHVQQFPTHNQLYSFKLRKLIKCSNPNCNNTNIYQLFLCNKCSTTMHDKYYNMKTAIWRREALCQIPNLICCEEHATWHIMNCDGPQGLVPIIDLECIRNGYYYKEGIVNDMVF